MRKAISVPAAEFLSIKPESWEQGSAPGRATRPVDFAARVFSAKPGPDPEFAAGLARPGADPWLGGPILDLTPP